MWIRTRDILPNHHKKVLAAFKNENGYWRTIIAYYLEAKKEPWDEDEDEGCIEYCKENDEYYYLEGWYENIESSTDFSYLAVDENISHWMGIPGNPDTYISIGTPSDFSNLNINDSLCIDINGEVTKVKAKIAIEPLDQDGDGDGDNEKN